MYYLSRAMIAVLLAAFTLGMWMRADKNPNGVTKSEEPTIARIETARELTPAKAEAESKDESDSAATADDKQDKKSDAAADKKKTESDDKAEISDKKENKGDKAEKADKDKKTDKKDDKKESDSDKTKTYTVKEESLNVVVSLDGVVESKRNTEVLIDPKTWTDWVVESAVSQGTRVKKGDTLVDFDTMKIDEDIRDEEANRKLAELELQQTGAEIRLLEQSMPVELQVAERANRLAEADLDLFEKEDRALAERQANFRVKMIGNQLDYQREQLAQLEKMYKADDLTEETEELILKRTRDQVEQYEFLNEIIKIDRDRLVKIELPRQEDQLKQGVSEKSVALHKAQTTLPISLDKLRLELEKQNFERKKAAEKLDRLEHDRKLMTVTAPADGLVYYGLCEQGEFKQAQSMANKLRKGGHVSPDEVFMTIVDPNSLVVRATIPEKDLWQIRRGMTGTTVLEGYDQERLSASIDSLSTVPAPNEAYLATVLVDWGRLPKELPEPVPGMDCKVKINAYSKDKALTLPAKAVLTDAQKDDQRYVWLAPKEKDEKPVRHNVKVGRTMDDRIEILDGLAAGDKVLREKPEEE